MRTRLLESALAKLNLALSVGPPNETGLHPICSWMVTVDFADDLEVTRLADGSISRYAILWHPDALHQPDLDWPVKSDLAVKMHQAIDRYTSQRLPVQMKLQKRIPVGSGLGGGSSDAAAMLRACNTLFDLQLDSSAMRHIAGAVGSDVIFLVEGGSAIVEGTGGTVEQLPCLPDLAAVLVLPGIACHTGDVYRTYDEQGCCELRPNEVRGAPASSEFFNDLAAPAQSIAPSLNTHASAISKLIGRNVHISGSGSTLFLTCDTTLEADAIASAIEEHLGLPTITAQPRYITQPTMESIS